MSLIRFVAATLIVVSAFYVCGRVTGQCSQVCKYTAAYRDGNGKEWRWMKPDGVTIAQSCYSLAINGDGTNNKMWAPNPDPGSCAAMQEQVDRYEARRNTSLCPLTNLPQQEDAGALFDKDPLSPFTRYECKPAGGSPE
jgi:hypothetical protein